MSQERYIQMMSERKTFHFGNPIKPGELEKAYADGMLKLEDLVHGAHYLGSCRNAIFARWSSRIQMFVYMRTKFSATFPETIEHPAKDDGFDLFTPNRIITEEEIKEFSRHLVDDESFEKEQRYYEGIKK